MKLEHFKSAVLDSLASKSQTRIKKMSMELLELLLLKLRGDHCQLWTKRLSPCLQGILDLIVKGIGYGKAFVF